MAISSGPIVDKQGAPIARHPAKVLRSVGRAFTIREWSVGFGLPVVIFAWRCCQGAIDSQDGRWQKTWRQSRLKGALIMKKTYSKPELNKGTLLQAIAASPCLSNDPCQ